MNSPLPPKERRAALWLLLCLIPGLWLWRLAASWLTGAGLFVDEAQYWDWSRQIAWGYFSKPPVLAVLIRVSTALGGDTLVGVRWLVVGLWTLTPLVLWRLTWEMLSQRYPQLSVRERLLTGAWAAALASACLVFGLIGEVATTDGPLLLSWAVLMWLFWRAQQAPERLGRWVLWGAMLALGILSKYTAVVALGTAIWLALRLSDRRVWFGLVLAGVVCLLLLLPHLAWNHAHGWPTVRHTAELISAQGSKDRLVSVSAAALYIVSQMVVVGPVVLVLMVRWAWLLRRPARADARVRDTGPGARMSLTLWAWHWSWPLWAVGLLQSLQGKGEMNWPAAATLGLALTLALWRVRLSAPLNWRGPWAVALVGASIGGVISLAGDWRDHLNFHGPGPRWDLWSRARGWDAAFGAMVPYIDQYPQATLVADERAVIAHSAYAWRAQGWRPLAWTSGNMPSHHYEMLYPWRLPLPGTPTPPVLYVSSRDDVPPAEVQATFARVQRLYRHPAPGRAMTLWLLERP